IRVAAVQAARRLVRRRRRLEAAVDLLPAGEPYRHRQLAWHAAGEVEELERLVTHRGGIRVSGRVTRGAASTRWCGQRRLRGCANGGCRSELARDSGA